jgi:thiamine biosynthesis protein ThiS
MLQVNGDPLEWTPDMTVRGVLRAKNYRFPLVVVSVDGVQVPREAYDSTPVPDGSVVQVLHLLSGG